MAKEIKKDRKDIKKEDSIVEILIKLFNCNEYRSDLIIFLIMIISCIIYVFTDTMGDDLLGAVLKRGMVLVAIDYVGSEFINKFFSVKKE